MSLDEPVMRPEYDFTGGTRGKYARALRENGYVIRIRNADGTVTEKQVAGEKTVILDPDVMLYFPDSTSVNRALRGLIALVPEEKRRVALEKGQRNSRTRKVMAKRRA